MNNKNPYEEPTLPSTNQRLGIGLQVLSGVEEDYTRQLIGILQQSPLSDYKTHLRAYCEKLKKGSDAFYQRAGKYLLEYLDTTEFRRAMAYTAIEEINLFTERKLSNKPISQLYVFLDGHKGLQGLGAGNGIGPSSILDNVAPGSGTYATNAPATTNNTTANNGGSGSSSSGSFWSNFDANSLFSTIGNLVNVGASATGNIMGGISSLKNAEAANKQVDALMAGFNMQNSQFNQLMQANKESSNNAYAQELQQKQGELNKTVQELEKMRNDSNAILQNLIAQKNAGSTDSTLLGQIDSMTAIRNRTDSALNNIGNSGYINTGGTQATTSGGGMSKTTMVMIGVGAVLVLGTVIFLATRKSGLKGVEDIPNTDAGLGSVKTHNKKKSYRQKRTQRLALQGISLDGIKIN